MGKSKIKLCKPIGQILKKLYPLGYDILEAYIDERERNDFYSKHHHEVGGLRKYLGLDDAKSVCDAYCVIQTDSGKTEHVLIEHTSKRKKRLRLMMKQIERTYVPLSKKRELKNVKVIVSGAKYGGLIKLKNYGTLPMKVAHVGDKPAYLEVNDINIPIMVMN